MNMDEKTPANTTKPNFKGIVNGVSFDNEEEFFKAVEEAEKNNHYNVSYSFSRTEGLENNEEPAQTDGQTKSQDVTSGSPQGFSKRTLQLMAENIAETTLRNLTFGLTDGHLDASRIESITACLEQAANSIDSNPARRSISDLIKRYIGQYIAQINYAHRGLAVSVFQHDDLENLRTAALPETLKAIMSLLDKHIGELDDYLCTLQDTLEEIQNKKNEYEARNITMPTTLCNIKACQMMAEELDDRVHMSYGILETMTYIQKVQILKNVYINILRQAHKELAGENNL